MTVPPAPQSDSAHALDGREWMQKSAGHTWASLADTNTTGQGASSSWRRPSILVITRSAKSRTMEDCAFRLAVDDGAARSICSMQNQVVGRAGTIDKLSRDVESSMITDDEAMHTPNGDALTRALRDCPSPLIGRSVRRTHNASGQSEGSRE